MFIADHVFRSTRKELKHITAALRNTSKTIRKRRQGVQITVRKGEERIITRTRRWSGWTWEWIGLHTCIGNQVIDWSTCIGKRQVVDSPYLCLGSDTADVKMDRSPGSLELWEPWYSRETCG